MQRVKQAQQGNEEAFLSLLDRDQDKLYRMIFAYVQNESDAVEVYQQVVTRAFEGITQLREPLYFSTWLMRIAINQSITYVNIRDRERPVSPETLHLIKADYRPIEKQLDLWQALQSLPNHYKTALLLRFYNDYTVPQIAKVIELPVGTVKTHIRRGLKMLRQQMKGVYNDEWAKSAEDDDE